MEEVKGCVASWLEKQYTKDRSTGFQNRSEETGMTQKQSARHL
ncbi:hypothetical protein [Pseudalkalibacillus caeni]|nr:hypothetical protein [Pseudalkalibacillus caeni]